MNSSSLTMNSTSLLMLLIPAIIMYTVALVTPQWFTLPSTSYGIWWVRFCDTLSTCQVMIAVLNDQPVWYLALQTFSILSSITLCLAIMLLSLPHMEKHILPSFITKLPATAYLLLVSVSSTMALIVLFYTKLSDPSHSYELPAISWSTLLALSSCMLQFVAALVLLVLDMNVAPSKSVCNVVCYKPYKYG